MDYTTDNNPTALYRAFAAVADIPAYVKAAAAYQPADVADLADCAFADTAKRELPIHEKEAAYLSAAQFFGEGEVRPPHVLARIKQAADVFGITEDIEQMRASLALSEEAEVEQVYALRFKTASGTNEAYPIGTPDDLILSAERAEKEASFGVITHEELRKAAVTMHKLAAAAGVLDRMPKSVLDLGVERLPSFEKAAAVAALRASHCPAGADASLYGDIVVGAAAEYAQHDCDPDLVEKWAGAWAELDRTYDIHYSAGVVEPYIALRGGQPLSDIAKTASTTVVVNDLLIPVTAFAAASPEHLDHIFPEDMAGILKTACVLAGEGEAAGASRELAALPAEATREFAAYLAGR